MFNFKKFFRPNPCLLTTNKSQRELLECFLAGKQEFDQWFIQHPNSRIRFQFYFPTAIDFYFDEFRLFTAYFKKGAFDLPELTELKMSNGNYNSIRSANWKPFEEVMLCFLETQEASNKAALLRKTKALYDYAAICDKRPAETSHGYSGSLSSVAAG